MAVLHSFFLSSFLLACLLCSSTYARFITQRCSVASSHLSNTDSSSFRTALIDALSNLASTSSASRSHRSSRADGLGFGKIHASYHCWRSIPSQLACKRCVESATKSIIRLCPDHQNATVWNSDCTLHYFTSHGKPLSTYIEDAGQENIPWAWWYSFSKIDEVTNRAQFNEALDEIMSSLIDKATNSSRSQRLYATGEVMVTVLDTLYGTVECSHSESPSTCRACLRAAVARVSGCCGGSRAAEVILPSCRLGYDVGPSMSRASLVGPLSSSSFSNIVRKSIAKR